MLPRVRFTRGGAFFCAGALAVGAAAIHSGNNLLFLLLGGMLGTITVSGVVSSLMMRRVEVERRVIGPSPVHLPLLIQYVVVNRGRWIPTFALTVSEDGLGETAYVAWVPAGGTVTVECELRFEKRGTYPLGVIRLATGFPFGLFIKERRIRRPAELTVWPRNDRRVGTLGGSGLGGKPMFEAVATAALGARGEFRSLREYRPGDDRRDIHWRSSARAGQPVVREYLGEASADVWLALDPRGRGGSEAEAALEGLASAATAAAAASRRFAVSIGERLFEANTGSQHLSAVLDALARLDFSPAARPPLTPAGTLLFSESAPAGTIVRAGASMAP